MTKIAVTFALPTESSGFLTRLRDKSRADRNGIRIIRGTLNDRLIEVFHTGVGEKVCCERVAKFLQNQQFEFLISAGFAGALNNELRAGDLLLARNFLTLDLNSRQFFPSWPIHQADLLTMPGLIDSSDERNEIARSTGAAAVDMETEFIARACAEHGIPLLSLRVITDTPQEPFPAPPTVLFDIERQRTHLLKLVRFFLTRPQRVPRLIQFARRILHARETLAEALVEIVREL
jgi:adenosylhomocysteine nucleosidase